MRYTGSGIRLSFGLASHPRNVFAWVPDAFTLLEGISHICNSANMKCARLR